MIIGICGRAGHGKTTLSLWLKENLGHGYILPMAAPLKQMCAALGLSHQQLYGGLKEAPDKRFGGKTARQIMQTLGTEWGREMVCPDIWTNAWKAKASDLQNAFEYVFCDDLRFPNEIEAVKALGGVLIGVVRPGTENEFAAHESERLDFEALGIPIILNDGTPEELYQKALSIIREKGRITS